MAVTNLGAHSSSGLGHRPLKAETTGSNPVCATRPLFLATIASTPPASYHLMHHFVIWCDNIPTGNSLKSLVKETSMHDKRHSRYAGQFDSLILESGASNQDTSEQFEPIVIDGSDILSVKLPFDFVSQSVVGDVSLSNLRHERPSLSEKEWQFLRWIRPGLFQLGPEGIRIWHDLAFAQCAEALRQHNCFYPSLRKSKPNLRWLAKKHQEHEVQMELGLACNALLHHSKERRLSGTPQFYLRVERLAVEFIAFRPSNLQQLELRLRPESP